MHTLLCQINQVSSKALAFNKLCRQSFISWLTTYHYIQPHTFIINQSFSKCCYQIWLWNPFSSQQKPFSRLNKSQLTMQFLKCLIESQWCYLWQPVLFWQAKCSLPHQSCVQMDKAWITLLPMKDNFTLIFIWLTCSSSTCIYFNPPIVGKLDLVAILSIPTRE